MSIYNIKYKNNLKGLGSTFWKYQQRYRFSPCASLEELFDIVFENNDDRIKFFEYHDLLNQPISYRKI